MRPLRNIDMARVQNNFSLSFSRLAKSEGFAWPRLDLILRLILTGALRVPSFPFNRSLNLWIRPAANLLGAVPRDQYPLLVSGVLQSGRSPPKSLPRHQ